MQFTKTNIEYNAVISIVKLYVHADAIYFNCENMLYIFCETTIHIFKILYLAKV